MVRVREICFLTALFVAIAFGFVKQIKVACRSFHSVFPPHEDAGEAYEAVRSEFENRMKSTMKFGGLLSYLSDRADSPGTKPAVQYYYDLQYRMAPFLVRYNEPSADLFFLDFSSPLALTDFCDRNRFQIVYRDGPLALAKKAGAER